MPVSRPFLIFCLLVFVPVVQASAEKTPALSNSIMSVVVALIFILLLIVSCAWALKKMSGIQGNTQGLVTVIGSQILGTKERLLIVKVDNKTLLLGLTANSISSLCELDEGAAERLQRDTTDQLSFHQQFKHILGRGKND